MAISKVTAKRVLYPLVLAAAVIIFLALLEDVLEGDVQKLDVLAYNFFVVKLRQPWLTGIMTSFSNLATPLALLVFTLFIEAFAPGKRAGICALLNIGCTGVINQVLKFIVQRPRPDGFRLVAESGYSFPSGHSMISMAFFGLCIWMIWHNEKNRRKRVLLCLCFAVLIVMVGISRIYLGVHYASDVIAGFCVSLVWLVIYTKLICPHIL